MAQTITTGIRQLVGEAEKRIQRVDIVEARTLLGREDVVFVDIRDIRELNRDGRMPGAFHCPRGMLEFWIDPDSPYHKEQFAADKRFIFFCAGGMRSVLAADIAQRMGLKPVADMIGGFGAWKAAGHPVDEPEKR